MNDRSLADMLTELDEELARQNDPGETAHQILSCVEARAPGSAPRFAAALQLRLIGCSLPTGW